MRMLRQPEWALPPRYLARKWVLWGNGGEAGIRTLEGIATLPVFKTGAFNRSATSP